MAIALWEYFLHSFCILASKYTNNHQHRNAKRSERHIPALVEIGAIAREYEHVLACGNADTSEGAHYFSF